MAIAKTRPVKKAKSRPGHVTPQQERAVQTRDHLLDVAGELLGEVGIENISTNAAGALSLLQGQARGA
jgi:hypothetical protein